MKWLAAFAILLTLAGSTFAASTPDDQYLDIYNEILLGDGLMQSDHPEAAALRYLQAQTDLTRLQTEHAGWNPDIVKYRQDYLVEKLQSLQNYLPGAKPQPAPAPPQVTTKPSPKPAPAPAPETPATPTPAPKETPPPSTTASPSPAPAPAPAPAAPSAQFTALQQENSGLKEQVHNLTSANTELLGRLKEALSVQPAAISPEQLAKAEARIVALQKERDLLSVALEQEKMSKAGAVTAKAAIDVQIAEIKAHSDAELRKAQEDLNRYKQASAEAQAKLDAANKEIDSLKASRAAEADQTAAVKARAEADAKRSEEEVAHLKEAGAESEKIIAAATRELELLKGSHPPEVEIAENSKQIPEERDQIKNMMAQISKDEAIISQLRTAADGSEQRLAAANNELQSLKTAHAAETQSGETSKVIAAERDRLKDELAARSKELADAETRHKDELSGLRDTLQKAESQRDDLEKKLAAVPSTPPVKETTAAATPSAPSKADLVKMDQMEARIAVLEAKPVPYTPEERALLKLSASTTPAEPPEHAVGPAHQHSVKDLPAGSGILWSEATRAQVAGDFQAAESKYNQILEQDPNNVFVLAFLANAQFAEGHLTECEKTVKHALSVDPEDPGSLYLLGLLRYREEKLDEAMDALSLSARVDPTNAATQNFLGCVLADKGLRAAAESALRKALQYNPDYADAHFNLAVVYANSQPASIELARWHYKRALALGHAKNPTLDKSLGESSAQSRQ